VAGDFYLIIIVVIVIVVIILHHGPHDSGLSWFGEPSDGSMNQVYFKF